MTKIEWVKDAETGEQGRTWNPTVGCTRISEGCRHCYAERMARRLQAMGRPEYQGTVNGNGRWTGTVNLVPERLEEPLRRKKPTTWFVDSMSDLFHEEVPFSFITKVFAVMGATSQHIYQILTKRPGRMLAFFNWAVGGDDTPLFDWPKDNVWLGVSTENQAAADERIPPLLRTPAAVRFVSAEPLLGPVDLEAIPMDNDGFPGQINALSGEWWPAVGDVGEEGDGVLELPRLDWIIAGGESGPNARPCHPDWLRQLRDGCREAGVPFFLKQRGEFLTLPELDGAGVQLSIIEALNANSVGLGNGFVRVGKKAEVARRLLDGKLHNEFPVVKDGR